MKHRYLNTTWVLVITMLHSFVALSQKVKHYDGNVQVDMDKHVVEAKFTITVEELQETGKLKLYVHKSARVSEISSGSTALSYSISGESFMGEDKALLIDKKGIDQRKLTVKYAYSLDSLENKSFLFNKEWLELNIYTTWFPFNVDYGLFTYNVGLELPDDYELIGSGMVAHNNNTWQIEQDIPFLDIPLIVSPKFKCLPIAKSEVKIYHVGLDKKSLKTLKKNTQTHYNRLSKMLGKPRNAHLVLAVNQFKRVTSYARKGFISLTIGKLYKTGHDKILAHEIAHLWWNKAETNIWEDWLNESFAEYSAILLQRKLYGEENFTANIQKLKKKVKGLPSVYALRRKRSKNQKTITYGGAYLLHQLENKIGRKAFAKLLKTLHQKKVSKTAEFLKIIENELGTETRTFTESKLNG